MSTSIEELLGSTGPFAQQMEHFRVRRGQLRLAQAVSEALAEQKTLVAEAATGTGKTLAYLVPALQSGKKTLISTGTKTLQDQLFQRDLPMVVKTLGFRGKTALLKGRANYLCTLRMEQTRAAGLYQNAQLAKELTLVYEWSKMTQHGEISELKSIADDAEILPYVTSTVDNCLLSQCPQFDSCHLFKARRKAVEADVVIVNHHLLFADMALKDQGHGEVLPTVEAFIIDEAHQVPDTATRFFSKALSSRQIRDLVNDTQAEAGEVSGGFGVVKDALADLEQTNTQLILQFAALNDRGHEHEIRQNKKLTDQLDELLDNLNALISCLEPLSEATRNMSNIQDRCNRYRETLRRFRQDEVDGVRWYEKRRRGYSIHITPLDIATPFQRFREHRPAAWVFTSATLAVGEKFDHFNQRLGLGDVATMRVESPFDHRHNGLCWLPQGLPAPGDFYHTSRLLETVWPLIEVVGGRTFFLFTTHRALQQAARWLKEKSQYPLFIQGESPRSQLVEDFRSAGNGILLGAASFWEGVDVPGPALSIVIIDKLPFGVPDDPVLQARMEAVRLDGGSPFGRIQLPEAVLALKQGAGRLIRDHQDCGVVVLGDPRITQKGYGRMFLNSLPPWPCTRETRDAIEFMHAVLHQQELQQASTQELNQAGQ